MRFNLLPLLLVLASPSTSEAFSVQGPATSLRLRGAFAPRPLSHLQSSSAAAAAEEEEENPLPDDASDEPEAAVVPEPEPEPTPEPEPAPTPEPEPTSSSNKSPQENTLYLQSLGAISGRGEFATAVQHKSAKSVIQQLEAVNPTLQPTQSDKMVGCWELVYSSTQLFRSSPFFMAGRAVCDDDTQREQYDWFCDMHRKALAMSSIQAVRQVVTSSGRLVSEFEVSAGAIPFLNDFTPFSYSGGLPVAITGALVSSADITPTEDGTAWQVYMDTVEIKGSNLPGLRQVLDQKKVRLESRQLAQSLEDVFFQYETPRPIFSTTYLDDMMRISRDQDDNVFVYVKTSSEENAVTDFSAVDADLGFLKLLEGFNNAVTKIYQ